jgi:hypothetical protein
MVREVSIAVAGAVVGGALAALAPRVFGVARTGIPRLLGIVKLTYVRTVVGGAFGLSAATAIALSTSDHSHKEVTYFVWYGLAALALLAAIGLTIAIDRGSERKDKDVQKAPGTPRLPRFAPKVPPQQPSVRSQRSVAAAKALAGAAREDDQREQIKREIIDELHVESISSELRAWLVHERERGEEYSAAASEARRRLAGERPMFEFLMFTQKPSPKHRLVELTAKAAVWSTKVAKRLERDVPSETSAFAGKPSAADPDPTQGDFGRLEDYIDARVDALKAILGEEKDSTL